MKRLLTVTLIILGLVTQAYAVERTGSIAANGQCVTLPNTTDTGNGSFQAKGTWSGTIAASATNDGSNWATIQIFPVASASGVTSFTANGIWTYTGAFKAVRLCATAWSSGTANVVLVATWARAGGGAGGTGSGEGTVTSVDLAVPGGGVLGVSGNPITSAGTLTISATGTSGGIPYFDTGTSIASSAELGADLPVLGGGAGVAPSTGTKTGNTNEFPTWTGAKTQGRCVEIGTSGNLQEHSGGCASGGGSGLTATTQNAHYTAVPGDFVLVDASGGAVTITLPAASGGASLLVHVKKIDSSGNAVTIERAGSDTIDGETTQVINSQYVTVGLISDGTASWNVF